eukprot:COSAG02_NODE_3701_length_6363_cov_4.841475_2_plen_474_part_00
MASAPEPEPEPEQPGDGAPEDAGWAFGGALSGLDQFSKAAAAATAAAAAHAAELAKQAGADDIIDAYKRDFAEFASVMADDAKVIEQEVVEAKSAVKVRAVELRDKATVAATEAIQSADAVTGGNITATRQAIKEGIVDTVQIVQAVGSELGLTEADDAGDTDPAGALLREAIAPLRVDRYGEMVRALRADQATFAAAPSEYAFIEWREARTRPDGTRLPLSPTESDAKSDAANDDQVQRWLAELVPEVLTPEVFWDRYLFRLAAFEAAEAKRAALMKSAAVHRQPAEKGQNVDQTASVQVASDDDEGLDGWGTSDEEDEPQRSEGATASVQGGSSATEMLANSPVDRPKSCNSARDGTPDAADEVLKKLEGELGRHDDGDDDSGSNGWGGDSDDGGTDGADASVPKSSVHVEHSPALAPAQAQAPDSMEARSRVAAAEASAAQSVRVAELQGAPGDSDEDSLDSWGEASLSD